MAKKRELTAVNVELAPDKPCERLLFRAGYRDILKGKKSPQEIFAENPCGYTLSCISKTLQTCEMVTAAIEGDIRQMKAGRLYGPVLKHVSKRVLTPEICKMACQQHDGNLDYIPQKLITSAVFEKFRSCLYGKAGQNLHVFPEGAWQDLPAVRRCDPPC